ncbi:hypothetical protein BO94DRAFT_353017 [Aspergillus sclerotioniger CBS 115572]|uniref:Uncharacterized protein n=1 Tax=Aspergillus sclerotioniger CBS 115572 TaxID=1450535 RepID=A0A317X5D9_9EURO|nr:hypothetical protein BO94DRAFT_353017 [Aspergillus sclerotioniger CBS 115572]PWY93789.1 hypothetical protein BO94DRAFT_353017 [Aspergillus sclerotioniger CBS 115572]
MARFSLSFLVLCLFLAIMATAMPIKRADPDGATEMDSSLAEEVAAKSLQSAAKMMDEMAGQADESSQKDDNDTSTSDKTNSTPSPSTSNNSTPETENKQQPEADNQEPTPTTPTSTESSAASSPQPSSSSHIVNNNPFANLPIVGGLLSGGGEGSLGSGLLP